VRSTDFFVEESETSPWVSEGLGPLVSRLNEDLLRSLRLGPLAETSDVSAVSGLLDLVQEELEAYGTDGSQQLDNAEIALAIQSLEAVTRRLGVPLQLPFRDFTRFRSYWNRNDGHGSWQARRDIIEGLFEPIRRDLVRIETSGGGPQLPEEAIANLRDPAAIQEQLGRIQRAIVDDPALAIGSAKELIESTAKAVLIERGLPVNDRDDLPALVSQAQRAIGLHPSSGSRGPDGTDAIKKILGGVITVTTGLAELRNRGYGTGHGAAGERVGLRARHAHLAVNAAKTWCQLMLDTLADPDAPWRSEAPTDQ
jgi:Abortive infection C-terminus